MKGFIDERASNTDSEYSVDSGNQAIPDFGEVILETEDDLKDSEKRN